MSKGSGRRPHAVPEAQVQDNWSRTFKPQPKDSRSWTEVGPGHFVSEQGDHRLVTVELDLCRYCGSDVSVCGEKLCRAQE